MAPKTNKVAMKICD